ncbi:hypothetical protein EVAR_89437_1 [Eumeta japonica]|uniref:Uncharacterized protein n=1 Tax=Eumeta variegata TaxID=151549 RepID=A0A4C1Z183_EUMVA|nr:hypothetical protein EVAR_89437_1 [Eumeta japonica]
MAINVSKTTALLTGSQRNMPDQLGLRDESCCVRKITSDSRLQDSVNISGPAEHSAPYDCGGRVVRQKRRDRQRLEN